MQVYADSRAYQQGYDAYRYGRSDVNPYPADTVKYDDWENGYYQGVIDTKVKGFV